MPFPTEAQAVTTGPQIDELRAAIRANQVIFPVPVPVFHAEYRADVQWRLVELYFVHGWSPMRLAERYKISSRRVRQSLQSWVRRARSFGYLQALPPANENWSELAPSTATRRIPSAFIPSAFIPSAERPQQHV